MMESAFILWNVRASNLRWETRSRVSLSRLEGDSVDGSPCGSMMVTMNDVMWTVRSDVEVT